MDPVFLLLSFRLLKGLPGYKRFFRDESPELKIILGMWLTLR